MLASHSLHFSPLCGVCFTVVEDGCAAMASFTWSELYLIVWCACEMSWDFLLKWKVTSKQRPQHSPKNQTASESAPQPTSRFPKKNPLLCHMMIPVASFPLSQRKKNWAFSRLHLSQAGKKKLKKQILGSMPRRMANPEQPRPLRHHYKAWLGF